MFGVAENPFVACAHIPFHIRYVIFSFTVAYRFAVCVNHYYSWPMFLVYISNSPPNLALTAEGTHAIRYHFLIQNAR